MLFLLLSAIALAGQTEFNFQVQKYGHLSNHGSLHRLAPLELPHLVTMIRQLLSQTWVRTVQCQLAVFQKLWKEVTEKAAFRSLFLSIIHCLPFHNNCKICLEIFHYWWWTSGVIFFTNKRNKNNFMAWLKEVIVKMFRNNITQSRHQSGQLRLRLLEEVVCLVTFLVDMLPGFMLHDWTKLKMSLSLPIFLPIPATVPVLINVTIPVSVGHFLVSMSNVSLSWSLSVSEVTPIQCLHVLE